MYDVAVIGSGPAGLFAAMELVNNSNLNVIVLEKARRLNDSRNVSMGWLGGCARASAKLFIDPDFGGKIATTELVSEFLERLGEYGTGNLRPSKKKLLKRSVLRANELGIEIDEPTTIAYAEDKMIKLGDFLYTSLREKATVIHKLDISKIKRDNEGFSIVTQEHTIKAKKVIVGLGRGGAYWLLNENAHFDFSYNEDYFDLGFRMEFPSFVFKNFADKSHHFRFRFGDFKTTVPVFLGTVETEEIGPIRSSNGRAWNSKKSPMVNMGILRRFYTKRPHKDIYRLSEIVNVLCDNQLMREPIGKMLKNETMLSHLPEFQAITEGLAKMTELFPALKRKCTIYAPETRLNSIRFNLSDSMESDVQNMYIVGDMSGHTNSFVQAACSGILAAKNILAKEEEENDRS